MSSFYGWCVLQRGNVGMSCILLMGREPSGGLGAAIYHSW